MLVLKSKLWNGRDEPKVAFASVSAEGDKPFNFLHVLFGMLYGYCKYVIKFLMPINQVL